MGSNIRSSDTRSATGSGRSTLHRRRAFEVDLVDLQESYSRFVASSSFAGRGVDAAR